MRLNPATFAPAPRREWPPAVVHGGPDHRELAQLGLRAEDLLDFSVCSNPLGASPRALRALGSVDPSRYPDRQALGLRSALADLHGVAPEAVLVGNGSVELIWLLAQVYLEAADQALVVGPTFGEYEAAVRRQQAQVVLYQASPADDFQPSLDEMLALVRATRPRLIFVCNPNNPTGQVLGLDELSALLAASDQTLLVVDEAYIDFLEERRPTEALRSSVVESALALRRDPRVVVLRSLTKSFGLAGLRLGYAVAAPEVVEALGRAQPPWSVNSLAQAAGLAALKDVEHVEAGRRVAAQAKAYLVEHLSRLGLRSLPSRAAFWLVEVGNAAGLRHHLLQRGILVRDCASFGLPCHLRLAARPLEECRRLVEATAALLAARR